MAAGQDRAVAANLGALTAQLGIANEMGFVGVPTPRETPTPISASPTVSPVTYQASPTVVNIKGINPNLVQMTPMTPVTAAPPSTLAPKANPLGPLITDLNASQGWMGGDVDMTASTRHLPTAPPLVHSHSFPNGHQLPSQIHGLAPPTTPVLPSPSFTASLGILHAPLISSPLAAMPVSRAPSPNKTFTIPEEEPMPPDIPRRPSLIDGRADGRPVITRSRSSSVNKWANHPTMTGVPSLMPSVGVPPSAWRSRQVTPDSDDDDNSDDEGPRKLKRRRSSGGDPAEAGPSSGTVISDDIRRQLDQIFEEFLNHVCSDRA